MNLQIQNSYKSIYSSEYLPGNGAWDSNLWPIGYYI